MKKISLHSSLSKQKLKTFESLFVVEVARDKQRQSSSAKEADRDLFLIVVLESGRDIDIDSLLKQELCHIPMALANTDGILRATNKSQLIPILEQGDVAQPQMPTSLTPTCSIIDAMALVQALGKPKGAKT